MMSSPRRIQPLPDVVVNQIAAGEVVERPASVVKELLENSLDAGATSIDIEVEGAGVQRILIRDDGGGIPVEELALALRRHCTSKLGALSDLESIATLGFRGEALPSIASVARLTLTSRVPGSAEAWRVEAEGSRVSAPLPAAHPPGTSVEVRDLFVHVPARRRFLRSPRTEALHVQDAIRRVALGAFDLRLQARVDGRGFLRLPPARTPAERLRRVAMVLGAGFVETALPLAEVAEGLGVEGWLGAPERARTSTDQQYLFLNGRAIRDPRLAHALRRAYEEWLPPGRFPACVLHLRVDPRAVDVNVHPAKAEVRFVDARTVHDFLHGAIRRALRAAAAPVAALAGHAQEAGDPATPAGRGAVPPAQRHMPDRGPSGGARAWTLYRVTEPGGLQAPVPGAPQPCALLGGRHLVCLLGGEDALLLVDARALPRALAALRWREALGAEGPPLARPLLLPESLPTGAGSLRAAAAAQDTLGRLGIDLASDGTGRVLLRGLPAALAEAEPARVLARLGALFDGAEAPGPESLMQQVLAAELWPEPTLGRATEALAGLLALPGGETLLAAPLARRLDAVALEALLRGEPAGGGPVS